MRRPRSHLIALSMIITCTGGAIVAPPAMARPPAAQTAPAEADPDNAFDVKAEWLPVRGNPDLRRLRGSWRFQNTKRASAPEDVAALYIDQSCSTILSTRWKTYGRSSGGRLIRTEDGNTEGEVNTARGRDRIAYVHATGANEGQGGPILKLSDRIENVRLRGNWGPTKYSTIDEGYMETTIERKRGAGCDGKPVPAEFIFQRNEGKTEITAITLTGSAGIDATGPSVGGQLSVQFTPNVVSTSRGAAKPAVLFRWPASQPGPEAIGSNTIRSGAQLHHFWARDGRPIEHWWREDDPENNGPQRGSWGNAQDVMPDSLSALPFGPGGRGQQVFYVAAGQLMRTLWNAETNTMSGDEVIDLKSGERTPRGPVTAMFAPHPKEPRQQVHVFFTHEDTLSLGHAWRDGEDAPWHSDTWDLPGEWRTKPGARPLAYAWYDQQHAFVRTEQDDLAHVYWEPGYDEPAHDLWVRGGERVKSNPTGFGTDRQQHVFYRNRENRLAHVFYDYTRPDLQLLRDYWDPSTAIAGDPAAILIGDRQIVVYRLESGRLRAMEWTPARGFRAVTLPAAMVHGNPSVTQREGELFVIGYDQHHNPVVWNERGAKEKWVPRKPGN